MKDDQITLRLPRALARALADLARKRAVAKSLLVREALEAYLAAPTVVRGAAWQRVEGMVGSLALDPATIERDALARQLRTHNWRD
ncbi:MAG TPA: ribbon-helix-helix domain-containing protein [Gemmatimonadaceae bacterium]|nr:ribbon-helix-helix domain-containing protein [Gemmatimonadaceae bacterium]